MSDKWFTIKCFLINIHWYFLFLIIKCTPMRVCVWVYHLKWLGISKLGELKGIGTERMYDYIKEKHGVWLLP